MLAELEKEEDEILKLRSQPLRKYLMDNVIPTLTQGLIQTCKLRPDDPIDHLAVRPSELTNKFSVSELTSRCLQEYLFSACEPTEG